MASKPADFMNAAARPNTCTRSAICAVLMAVEMARLTVRPMGLNERDGPSGRCPAKIGFLVKVPA